MVAYSYRRDIDGLRALAVLPVVLGHAGLAGFSGGFVGVDVFFVISGYLITGILARELAAGQFSLLNFYERRARRILPALFVMLVACFVGGYLILTPEALEGLGQATGATLLFMSNMWFWASTGDYFGTAAELEPLLHTWSLAVEEQFYIFFPLILWAIAARGRRSMIFVVAALSVVSFIASLWATSRAPEMNFYFAATRAWELGLGALLALAVGTRALEAPVGARNILRDVAGLVGLALIIGPIVFYDSQIPFPGMAAVPPCLGAVLILWSGTVSGGLAGRILGWAPFVWIGLISYSLYLWHWPVQVFYRVMGNTLHLSLPDIFASVAVALVLGWLSWRFVERPFRQPAPQGFGQAAIFKMSLAGAVVLGGLSLAVFATQGLPSRIPASTLTAYTEALRLPPMRKACFGVRPDQPGGLCQIGADMSEGTAANVLVWGDSHVDALLPGIDQWMAENQMAGYVAMKAGCPPLLGLQRADRGQQHDCAGHNDAVMRFLNDKPDIDTVVLHARWAMAVEGLRAPGESGSTVVFVSQDTASEKTAHHAQNHALVAHSLRKTLAQLRAIGREVVIIDTIPEIGWSVPEALFGAGYVGSTLPEAPDLQSVELRNRRFRALLDPFREAGQVRVVSLAQELCIPVCQVEQAGKAIYRDDDHLSVWAARTFGPRLMQDAFVHPPLRPPLINPVSFSTPGAFVRRPKRHAY